MHWIVFVIPHAFRPDLGTGSILKFQGSTISRGLLKMDASVTSSASKLER